MDTMTAVVSLIGGLLYLNYILLCEFVSMFIQNIFISHINTTVD